MNLAVFHHPCGKREVRSAFTDRKPCADCASLHEQFSDMPRSVPIGARMTAPVDLPQLTAGDWRSGAARSRRIPSLCLPSTFGGRIVSDWIEWNGGECPVETDTRAHIRFLAWDQADTWRDLRKNPPIRAGEVRWSKERRASDIIAYRIISPQTDGAVS